MTTPSLTKLMNAEQLTRGWCPSKGRRTTVGLGSFFLVFPLCGLLLITANYHIIYFDVSTYVWIYIYIFMYHMYNLYIYIYIHTYIYMYMYTYPSVSPWTFSRYTPVVVRRDADWAWLLDVDGPDPPSVPTPPRRRRGPPVAAGPWRRRVRHGIG